MSRLTTFFGSSAPISLRSTSHWGRASPSTFRARNTGFRSSAWERYFSSTTGLKNRPKAGDLASTERALGGSATLQEVARKRRRFNRWTVTIFMCMCVGFAAEKQLILLPDGVYDFFGVSRESILDVMKFKPFTLISREAVSSSLAILELVPSNTSSKSGSKEYEKFWSQGIWSVEFKQPQLQIARRYTPLPPSGTQTSEKPDSLSFLIRREYAGEVSRYLHNLAPGSEIEVRGGYLEYEIPNDIEQVVFLAGGTGIAPALQVAHILEQRSVSQGKNISLHILWANRSRQECVGGINFPTKPSSQGASTWSWLSGLWGGARTIEAEAMVPSTEPGPLVQRLELLRADDDPKPGLRLKISYFVDDEGTFIKKESIAKAMATLSGKVGDQFSESCNKKLLLTSGPDGFVSQMAGAKRLWRGIEYQGSIGGLLAKINYDGWEIHKL